jgi:hypothetical protein
MDPDPVSGGAKTCGSGSPTLTGTNLGTNFLVKHSPHNAPLSAEEGETERDMMKGRVYLNLSFVEILLQDEQQFEKYFKAGFQKYNC